jgi:hypothetical protein
MTRDDVLVLLRRRWRSTDQRFDEETVDIWWEQLGDVDTVRAYRALKHTIDGGATKVALGDICRLAVDSKPVADLQQRYRDETGHSYDVSDPRHPEHREHGCECWRNEQGAWQLCAMHTERANRWLGIIARQRDERARGIRTEPAEPIEVRF